jgi:hypothetical protein
MTVHSVSDPLFDLSTAAESVWLDDLSRELLAGGGFETLIRAKRMVGVWDEPGATIERELRSTAPAGARTGPA